jgi:hypothetical protein
MELYDLLQCVDRALDKFGSNTKQATYWTLMTKEGISSDRIVTNPDALVRILEEIFGVDGSKIVEKAIVKEIKKTFTLENPSSYYNLNAAFDTACQEIPGISISV